MLFVLPFRMSAPAQLGSGSGGSGAGGAPAFASAKHSQTLDLQIWRRRMASEPSQMLILADPQPGAGKAGRQQLQSLSPRRQELLVTRGGVTSCIIAAAPDTMVTYTPGAREENPLGMATAAPRAVNVEAYRPPQYVAARRLGLRLLGHTEYTFAVHLTSGNVRQLRLTTRYKAVRELHRRMRQEFGDALPPLPPSTDLTARGDGGVITGGSSAKTKIASSVDAAAVVSPSSPPPSNACSAVRSVATWQPLANHCPV